MGLYHTFNSLQAPIFSMAQNMLCYAPLENAHDESEGNT